MIQITCETYDELIGIAKRIVGEPAAKAAAPVETEKAAPAVGEVKNDVVTEPVNTAVDEVSAEPEETTAETPVEATADNTYTLEEVRAKMAELTRGGKREVAKQILSDLGVSKLSELQPDMYPQLMKKVGEV